MDLDFLNGIGDALSDGFGLTPQDLVRLGLKMILGTIALAMPFVVYFCVSLPLRRRERAHLFLDLVEEGLRRGQNLESTIRELARTGDRSLGRRFRRLALELDDGLSLNEAMAATPNLLPVQVEAILCSGHAAGDVRKVLPACRLALRDSRSQVRAGLNYLPILSLGLLPVLPVMVGVLQIWVIPKLAALERDSLPEAMLLPQHSIAQFSNPWLVVVPLAFCGILTLLCAGYVAGPWLQRYLQPGGFPYMDWLEYRVPWRRRRLKRDFCNLLAVLLDSGLPESEAVSLAARGMANASFRRRAARIGDRLRAGVSLTEAVQVLDPRGELRWRLTTSARAGGGFVQGLETWLESLDASAFQSEQAATHLFTTGLVIVNGVIVGLMAYGLIRLVVQLTEAAPLW
jgi:general secretion pathway protein F